MPLGKPNDAARVLLLRRWVVGCADFNMKRFRTIDMRLRGVTTIKRRGLMATFLRSPGIPKCICGWNV